jgi:hypothetical protein
MSSLPIDECKSAEQPAMEYSEQRATLDMHPDIVETDNDRYPKYQRSYYHNASATKTTTSSESVISEEKLSSFMKDIYELIGKPGAGTTQQIVDMCDPSVEWVVNGPYDLLKCRDFHGKDGVRIFFETLGATWKFGEQGLPRPLEIHFHGSTAIVIGEEHGVSIETQEPFSCRWSHFWDVDMKTMKILRFREFLCVYTGQHITQVPEMTTGNVVVKMQQGFGIKKMK